MTKKVAPFKKRGHRVGQKLNANYNELSFLEEPENHEHKEKKPEKNYNEGPLWNTLIEFLQKDNALR
ncbi:hypothetical protein C8Z91_11390 [Paenibacillus elgii]|uniref:Uncharacterized protein n=1 Tax=Paenibacillus elgii TaxID=189691 RepID=A0A2T6G4K3_9BACL|nr:hypothetical protein [Paenibacillus elgii]PUA39068.1 hypothetical protein C8Z91_11390 [Paenibacillus elgii]